jgi:Tfp pilus assembly protein PilX
MINMQQSRNVRRRVLKATPHRQRGVATLLVALVVLLVMTITGLALVRTTTLGAGVSGSLALKRSATSGADLGLETGLSALKTLYETGPNLLDADATSSGYFASVDPKVEAKDLPWSSSAVAATNDGLGNEVRYLIHRLCSQAGGWNSAGQSCVLPSGGGGCPGSSDSAGSVQVCNDQPMYRITAQVKGPKDTLSYVQMSFY